MGDVLVQGGTVVDGSGGASYVADVRIRGGVIVEIGPDLVADGETVIDAHGALVTPGFVDSHTHYDLEMFWDPTFDPLPTYGVTTTIMGNCGFGIAPTRADTKADVGRPVVLRRRAAGVAHHVDRVGLVELVRVLPAAARTCR